MSDFTFACPLCHKDILCDAQYHGQSLQCPLCNGEITAPAAPPARPPGQLAIRMTGGEKPAAPNLPIFQKPAVAVKPKPGLSKGIQITVSLLLVLIILFVVARFTSLNRYLPAALGGTGSSAAETAAAGSSPGQSTATPAETAPTSPPPPPAPVLWTTNLANVVIPTNAARGTISSNDFQCDLARIDNGILSLRQGKGPAPELELGLLFGLKAGESPAGKTLTVASDVRVAPRVWKRWKAPGKLALQQKVYSKGYTLKLQFGEVNEDKVPGQIYLSLPDEEQSVVAGSFVATMGAAVVLQPAAQPTTPTAAPMSEEMRKRYGVRNPGRP